MTFQIRRRPPLAVASRVQSWCWLFIVVEVSTFACEREDVGPDVYMLGKALGCGIVPVSAVVSRNDVLGVITPGSHGWAIPPITSPKATSRPASPVLCGESRQVTRERDQQEILGTGSARDRPRTTPWSRCTASASRTASDEVALELREDHSHVRHRLAHRRAAPGRPIARPTPAYSLAVSGLVTTTARWISRVSPAMARVSSVLVSSSCSSTRKSWSAFCCWKVAWRF